MPTSDPIASRINTLERITGRMTSLTTDMKFPVVVAMSNFKYGVRDYETRQKILISKKGLGEKEWTRLLKVFGYDKNELDYLIYGTKSLAKTVEDEQKPDKLASHVSSVICAEKTNK